MSYITRSDLLDKLTEQQLVQLTDDEKTALANEPRIANAIADAESEVNGYVAVRHTVPVSPAPALLKSFSKTIAVKNLYSRRQRVPENVREEYNNAIAQLKDIAKGLLTLGIDPAPAESTKGSSGETFGPERVFDRDKMGGF